MVKIKRVYEPRSPSDGERILVDHLWPRGLTRRAAGIDEWMKALSPSTALRRWFGHVPRRWPEFRRRFRQELRGKRGELAALAKRASRRRITLVYGARDTAHNNAVVLKMVLDGVAKGTWSARPRRQVRPARGRARPRRGRRP